MLNVMKPNKSFSFFLLLICILLFVSFSSVADEVKPPKLFSDTNELSVTLTGPWYTIRKQVKDNKLYPVTLSYRDASGQQQTIKAQVGPRGITRRLKVCKFPPLKIHFDKEEVKGTPFRGNKSLKLVTYCDTNRKYEQYYIKEFLAYRIYNLITELSFRVKPMMIEYKDIEENDSITRFGFLIEDLDDVAKRNKLEKLTLSSISLSDLDAVASSNFSLFEYMIGNLDWAALGGPKDSCCHNSRLIGAGNDINPKYGVPYDFDSSGLVNAHYAAPPSELRVRDIRQRLYRGFCPFNFTLPQTVDLFNEKKMEILSLFEKNTHLDDKKRAVAIDYIESFYEIINDPSRFEKLIIDKCRG